MNSTLTRISREVFATARAARTRTMLEFAEQEIVIPAGRADLIGTRFRWQTQPYTRHVLQALDERRWNLFAFTGPTQSGKTLITVVIPMMYFLFERRQSVLFGLPDMDMAGDKWFRDLRPAILASRYAEFLPTSGGGSRGGRVELLKFGNGTVLKFMSAGGGEKSRAGYSSPILIMTEVDGYDESGDGSRETDKISQMIARTDVDPENRIVIMECTTSVEDGAIWRAYQGGTRARLGLECAECHVFVTPERQHLRGWEDTETAPAAKRAARLYCPACGMEWTDSARRSANEMSLLLMGGQTAHRADDGEVIVEGEAPETDTFSMRWNAANNLFWPVAELGGRMWNLAKRDNEEAEREACQFVWAVPYQAPILDTTPLDAHVLESRTETFPKGIIPADTQHLCVGLDIGKWQCHWAAVASRVGSRYLMPDYGVFTVQSNVMAEEMALMAALREWRDLVERGWLELPGEVRRVPEQVWIDSRYHPELITKFCIESGPRYRPTQSYGSTQAPGRFRIYSAPKRRTKQMKIIGEAYHVTFEETRSTFIIHINADHWKTWLHRRLATPLGEAGSLALFDTKDLTYGFGNSEVRLKHKHYHRDLTESLTAERLVEKFVPGRGPVQQWEVIKGNKSHWLDATYLACTALHFVGARLSFGDEPQPENVQAVRSPMARAEKKAGWQIGR